MEPRLKILVVEDDASVRPLLVTILEREKYEVVAAGDGAAALTVLAENPDVVLIILDWMMPIMNGIDVLRELQLQPSPPPVLMLTARMGRDDVATAIREGALDYVLKPIQRDVLLDKIRNILNRNHDEIAQRAARRKPINLPASTAFTIVDITETGCCLDSSFPLPLDAVLFLESDPMILKLDLPRTHRFTVRVTNCEGKGNRYRISCDFVGLTPLVAQKIRQICQAAGWTR